ncbi:type II secretion system protein [Pseudoduganella sp. FT55W]|uniref:Type II secretion system protein n=1 Tax=Duganella rivi TaxID=2666083 RepID=A0A7X4GS53_9BURK|nr:type II secretion system protein [Duganella rivi]MYM67634.1 type II secretion system protein [Duganella rivi]
MSIKRQRGLTLIELVIFMVIVGAAAAGIMGVLNIGGSQSADPLRRKQALMIAEAFMEEVLMARFTFCNPSDPNAADANAQGDCSPQLAIGLTGGSRPFGNVANYGGAAGMATRSFIVNGVDADINGRPLGQNAGLATIGNASLSGITTTVTLNFLVYNSDPNFNSALGPDDVRRITSQENDIRGLHITVRTAYGGGPNDFVELDAYRTRYAPKLLP